MYYIGVDLGTSAVKLLLMEESGKICNIVSKEYPLFFPHPGWSEQNPEDWFTKSMRHQRTHRGNRPQGSSWNRFWRPDARPCNPGQR